MYLESRQLVIKDSEILDNKKQTIKISQKSTVYCFVFKDNKNKKNIEVIDMSKYLDDIQLEDNQEIINKYKSFLVRFNSTLKEGESARTYISCYNVENIIQLKKI